MPGLCELQSAGSWGSSSQSMEVQQSHHGFPSWSDLECSVGLDVTCPRVGWELSGRWRLCREGVGLEWSEEESVWRSVGGGEIGWCGRLRPGWDLLL